MREILILYFLGFSSLFLHSQDLYNPDLIKSLNVRIKKVIISGAINDTTEYQYDIQGRLVYKKDKKYGEKYIDSLFYEKNIKISKNYTISGILKSSEETKFDKNGNIIKFERNQLLPISDKSGYESVYKNGELISSKMLRNGEVINTQNYNEKKENKTDSIIYYENDTSYFYTLNNYELISFHEGEGALRKNMGDIAFDDNGNIIWTTNYVNNRPNEVSVIIREYDNNSKTYTEVINKEYYYSNGLQMRKEDNEHNMVVTYYYEFY